MSSDLRNAVSRADLGARVAAAYRSDDAFVAGLLLAFGLAGMWLAFMDALGSLQLCAILGG